MNNLCEFKRGFFTLRACNRPATKQCESCQKLSCPHHLSAQTGMSLCVICAQAKQQIQYNNYHEDDWIYSYRSYYYATGYEPFRFGRSDYDSFENYDDSSTDWDDDYSGDFYDS